MIIFKRKINWDMEGDAGVAGGGAGSGGDGGDVQITPEIASKVFESWRDHLPEEMATDSTLEGFNGKPFHEVVKGYASLSRKLGKNPIVMPGQDAKPEEWAEFYNSLGRPSDGKGYEIGKPENAPDGWQYNTQLEELARGVFHEAGLRPDQAQKIWSKLMGFSTENWQAQSTAANKWVTENMEALKKDWGQEFGARSKGALQLADSLKMGDQSIGEWMRKTGLDKNPMMLKALGEVWSAHYREGDLGGGGGTGQLSSREAMSKIRSIMEDPKGAYRNPDHPGHRTAVDEVERLHQIAYPEEG